MLESGGSETAPRTTSLSTPSTATRSGTGKAIRRQASRTCSPRMSLHASTAIGLGSESSQRATSSCSCSQVRLRPWRWAM